MDKTPSLLEIRRAIPSRCFKSNVATSLFYVARSLVFLLELSASLYLFRSSVFASSPVLSAVAHIAYAICQGTVFWGIFTIGHDAGHGALSRYATLNWIMGNTLHSFLLTPYEPWRQSHRSHHYHTGNAERDEIFYPDAPMHHKLLTATLGPSWFLYIVLKNVPGRRNYGAYIWSRREFVGKLAAILTSFLSLLGVVVTLFAVALRFGWIAVVAYYFAPLLVFASWLVVVTFLHHNDADIHDLSGLLRLGDAIWR